MALSFQLDNAVFVGYNGSMRTDYLNPQIYNRLYSVMTYENVLALRVTLETGLRIDDVLSLRHEQLNGRTLRGTAEKTGKPFKKVISQDLANRLKNLCGSVYLFKHRTKPGEHRTRQAVWANMKKAAAVMGVKLNAAPHSARKTYAVDVFKDKGINAVQKELQHDRISTTMIYAFSNLLTDTDNVNNVSKNDGFCISASDFENFAEIVAEKVVKKLEKNKNPA